MKKTKSVLSAIVAVALLTLSICLTAFAAENPSIELDKGTAEPGKTVTLTVTLSGNTGITYLRVTPETDNEAVTLTSVSNGDLFPTMDEGINLVFSADTEIKTGGTLCTLTFTVAEDAALNSTVNVTLTVRECYNDRYEDVALDSIGGVIEIGCTHAETTDTVTKEPSCTDAGTKTCVCNACGYETEVTVPATGHKGSDNWETTKAPQVGVAGEMVSRCTVCNEITSTQTIPALTEDQVGGDTLKPAAPSGCGSSSGGATAAITTFFTAILPALAVVLGKKFLF